MNKLKPISNQTTRHLFIDPVLSQPWCFREDGYQDNEKTSYIKPGVVPNLMALCTPAGHKFSVTEEPDINNMFVDDLVIAMFNEDGEWGHYTIPAVNAKFNITGPSTATLDGHIVIRDIVDVLDECEDPIRLPEGSIINIPIYITYHRATRELILRSEGNFDNGKPQILGITLDLKYKDSKSTKSLFKSAPAEIKQTYRREIAA